MIKGKDVFVRDPVYDGDFLLLEKYLLFYNKKKISSGK
jgi:hypothetical protein